MKSNQKYIFMIIAVVVLLAVAYFFYDKKKKEQKAKDEAANNTTKQQAITPPEKPAYVDNFKAEKYENVYDFETYPWERCTLPVDEVQNSIKWWLNAYEKESAEQRLKNLKNKYASYAKQYPSENLTFKQWFIQDVEWMLQQ